ncbi:DUF2310 family Zn-ribbon-containing protein [Sporomusa sphaeroides]|uniref:DUF2310 family Zn-ribbon-containing protein n=1 Tax=Sporomusa sphaeroides TaxID=47679 RepID=UPI003D7C2B6E
MKRIGSNQICYFSQLSKHDSDSSLAIRGREICNRITVTTGILTYYYLLKSSGKGLKAERARKCPSCKGEWLLQEPLHGLFNFQCDRLQVIIKYCLVSSINRLAISIYYL